MSLKRSGHNQTNHIPLNSATNGDLQKQNRPEKESSSSQKTHLLHMDNKEENKFKLIITTLKRFVGVGDLARVRLSLPSQLLEPIGSLEYWTYVDRPDYFIALSKPENPLDRMLAVVRWICTKDLKYVRGKVVKPYNSILGEYFRCIWQLNEPKLLHGNVIDPNSSGLLNGESEITYAHKYGKSSPKQLEHVKRHHLLSFGSSKHAPSNTDNSTPRSNEAAPVKSKDKCHKKFSHKVVYLCEQTSHHPPVSAFIVTCPKEGIELRGMDQLSAKFTGTTIKIKSGEQNKGLFLDLKKWSERYHCSHPVASISGFLMGHLNIHVHDELFITCLRSSLKCIIKYHEEVKKYDSS